MSLDDLDEAAGYDPTQQDCTEIYDTDITGQEVVNSDHDPRRCQNVTVSGQCRRVALECKEKCKSCSTQGANPSAASSYRLKIHHSDVEHHATHEKVMSLAGEVGMLRTSLELLVNQCNTSTDFLLKQGQMGTLIAQVKDTVLACHKLDEKTGNVLSKPALIGFADGVVSLFMRLIQDPKYSIQEQADLQEKLANGIDDLVSKQAGQIHDPGGF